MLPNDFPWLDGSVETCGALAPDAVEVMVAEFAGAGKVPSNGGFCPGGVCGNEGEDEL